MSPEERAQLFIALRIMSGSIRGMGEAEWTALGLDPVSPVDTVKDRAVQIVFDRICGACEPKPELHPEAHPELHKHSVAHDKKK